MGRETGDGEARRTLRRALEVTGELTAGTTTLGGGRAAMPAASDGGPLAAVGQSIREDPSGELDAEVPLGGRGQSTAPRKEHASDDTEASAPE